MTKRNFKGRNTDPIDEEFRRMEEEMKKMMEDFMSLSKRNEALIRQKKPLVYGFSVKLNPAGKPEIRQFGNVRVQHRIPQPAYKGKKGEITSEVSREPLIDIIEGRDEITVIAELPGAGKQNIDINTTESTVTIRARLHDVNYHRNIALPARVNPKSAKATYKNGVLEVKISRTGSSLPSKHVEIE